MTMAKFEIKYSLEYLKKLAEPYSRRIDFKNAYPKEYSAAQHRGILDDVCSHMPKRKIYTLEMVMEIAAPCKTSGEFWTINPAAYRAAVEKGWMDIVCAHMERKYQPCQTERESFSVEKIKKRASRFDKVGDFKKYDNKAYESARRRGILQDVCKDMNRQWIFHTIDECSEAAQKYEYRNDFRKGAPTLYDYARRHGWLDEICKHMKRKYIKWTKIAALAEARKYEIIQDFREQSYLAYNACHQNGWIKEATQHMVPQHRSRTFEECQADAIKYKTRCEYKDGNYASYSCAQSHGWLDDVCKHMERVGDVYWRMVYVYEFKDGSAYVGLTCNYTRRKWQHLNEEADPVYKHIAKGNTEYDLIELSGYIPKDDAAKMEDDYITKYRNEGWHMLNTRRGGSLGYPRRMMKKK